VDIVEEEMVEGKIVRKKKAKKVEEASDEAKLMNAVGREGGREGGREEEGIGGKEAREQPPSPIQNSSPRNPCSLPPSLPPSLPSSLPPSLLQGGNTNKAKEHTVEVDFWGKPLSKAEIRRRAKLAKAESKKK
jgi:hypothetical protein